MKKIFIAGDLFPFKHNEELFRNADIEKLFGEQILNLFKFSDLSICNLEGTLTTSKIKTLKLGPNIKAHPDVLHAYKELGIDLLATANNHINDFCQQGYLDTIEAIAKYNLSYIGSGINKSCISKYQTYQLDGVRICIYNVAETMFNIPSEVDAGVNLYDEYLVCQDLFKLKERNDIIIVLYHGGVEYFQYPTIELRKRFRRMADSGADIVVAQHTHCIGCEEYYKNSYLLYGQGNFLFRTSNDKECTKTGLGIEVLIDKNKHFSINKYFVKDTGGVLEIVNNPTLLDFEERGSHINDDNYIVDKFREFVMTQRKVKTKQFRKYYWYDRILKKIFPSRIYSLYDQKFKEVKFSEGELLRFLYTIRSEQQRETALYIVLNELQSLGCPIK